MEEAVARETRCFGAQFDCGDRTELNNDVMRAGAGAGAGIRIGRDGLFGAHAQIFDSDFHSLDPGARNNGHVKTAPVEIGDCVDVGMGVRILKGATIGDGSVIGAGAVVAGSIPVGVVAGWQPRGRDP